MSKITLNDGTEYAVDWCGASAGNLRANILKDGCMAELAAVFDDPAKTSRIAVDTGLETAVHEGYTHLRTIDEGGWSDGATLITLIKEQ